MSEAERLPVDLVATGAIQAEADVLLLRTGWNTDPAVAVEIEKQAAEQYVQDVVVAALEGAGVDKTSPGFHNARFAATHAVWRVLEDVREHEAEIETLMTQQQEKR